MTLGQAVYRARTGAGVELGEDEIISIISGVDGRFFDECLRPLGLRDDFPGYDGGTDLTTELLADKPYEDVYIFCLKAMEGLYDGDTERYSSFAPLYNSLFSDMCSSRLRRASPPRIALKTGGDAPCFRG